MKKVKEGGREEGLADLAELAADAAPEADAAEWEAMEEKAVGAMEEGLAETAFG